MGKLLKKIFFRRRYYILSYRNADVVGYFFFYSIPNQSIQELLDIYAKKKGCNELVMVSLQRLSKSEYKNFNG